MTDDCRKTQAASTSNVPSETEPSLSPELTELRAIHAELTYIRGHVQWMKIGVTVVAGLLIGDILGGYGDLLIR